MRSPTYRTLDDWILGRLLRHPSSSMPAHMLEKPPDYLLANEYDARDKLTEFRNAGCIAAHSKRWYLTKKGTKLARAAVKAASHPLPVL